jgi:hypothetical protein
MPAINVLTGGLLPFHGNGYILLLKSHKQLELFFSFYHESRQTANKTTEISAFKRNIERFKQATNLSLYPLPSGS